MQRQRFAWFGLGIMGGAVGTGFVAVFASRGVPSAVIVVVGFAVFLFGCRKE
jgi:hypothetical protein